MRQPRGASSCCATTVTNIVWTMPPLSRTRFPECREPFVNGFFCCRRSMDVWNAKSRRRRTNFGGCEPRWSVTKSPVRRTRRRDSRVRTRANPDSSYVAKNPHEQARIDQHTYRTPRSIAASLSPTYVKPFDVFAKGSETGDWLAALDDFRNSFRWTSGPRNAMKGGGAMRPSDSLMRNVRIERMIGRCKYSDGAALSRALASPP